MTLHVLALLAALALVPVSYADAPPPASSPPADHLSLVSECPVPTERQVEIALRRVRFLLEQEVKAPWRSELGLVGATMGEVVALIGPEHAEACAELQALGPLDAVADPFLYFQVRDVYLVVPAYLNLGESLIVTFKGEISYGTMHLSTF